VFRSRVPREPIGDGRDRSHPYRAQRPEPISRGMSAHREVMERQESLLTSETLCLAISARRG
jgi:hypothetical protein